MRDRAIGPSSLGRQGLALAAAALLALGAFLARAHQRAPELGPAAPHAAPPARPAPPKVEAKAALIDNPRVALGRQIFFDRRLSEPEGTSCATCHDPAHGYAGNNGSTLGVAHGSRPGRFARRNTPSVLYLRFVRRFHVVWDDESELPEASGGFFWDGRSDSIATLVQQPLLNPNEMGNRDFRQIAHKLATSPYADALLREFDDVFATTESAVAALGFCLEAFLTSPQMSPFSSKYDEYVRGHVTLDPLEARGLALFKDGSKGSCNSCHKLDDRSPMPERSMFTDYGYDAVAVPRNRKLGANANAAHFDLGVCERRDKRLHTEDEWFCGAFRTPSLRNVATRASFMHNGVFSNLRDVVAFYATRGTDPKRWYETGSFDDLPEKYRKYVNVNTPPYDLPEGETPRLDDRDIDAIVAFLGTLTDRE